MKNKTMPVPKNKRISELRELIRNIEIDHLPSEKLCRLQTKVQAGKASQAERDEYEKMREARALKMDTFKRGARWVEAWRKAAAELVIIGDGAGRAELKSNYFWDPLDELKDLIGRLIENKESEAIGGALVDIAYSLTAVFKELCEAPPEWFVKRVAGEPVVPWFVLGGKLDPEFEKADCRLKFGSALLKRGKMQFDAIATRHVLHFVERVSKLRNLFEDQPWLLDTDENGDSIEIDPLEERIAMLPDLSVETRGAWWEIIKDQIKRDAWPNLPAYYRKNIAESLTYPTRAAIVTEHLKRCKKAFFGLIPKK